MHITFKLSKLGVARVSDEQLQVEAARIEATTLQIPLAPYSAIVVVHDWESLQIARAALLGKYQILPTLVCLF